MPRARARPTGPNCQAFERFIAAVQAIKNSGRLQALRDAWEANDRTQFETILDQINMDGAIRNKIKQGAQTRSSVSFNWY